MENNIETCKCCETDSANKQYKEVNESLQIKLNRAEAWMLSLREGLIAAKAKLDKLQWVRIDDPPEIKNENMDGEIVLTDDVLMLGTNREVTVKCIHQNEFPYLSENYTHWMPTPELPKAYKEVKE